MAQTNASIDWNTCGPQSAQIDIGTAKLRCSVRGPPRQAGLPILICEAGHGASGTWWMAVARHLETTIRTIYYDRAGLGQSSDTEVPRTAENMAKDLKQLLDAIDVKPPYILAAHSFGGIIIREFFELCTPGDIVGMVLADTNHERTLRALDIPWKTNAATMSQLDFLEVTGFHASNGLLPEEYDAIFKPATPGNTTGDKDELPNLIPSSDALLEKKQIERQIMAPYPVVVIKANAARDSSLVYEAAKAKGIGTEEQYADMRAFQERVEKYFEPLQRELLGLTSPEMGTFVYAKGGHVVPLAEPELVSDGVKRILKVWEEGKKD